MFPLECTALGPYFIVNAFPYTLKHGSGEPSHPADFETEDFAGRSLAKHHFICAIGGAGDMLSSTNQVEPLPVYHR